ncbi:hypothetical protein KPP03845_105020 [Streptomyces xanthophaeus]|nr:hypothetical protein [Streptomyces xanthophaeus]WCD88611.1 hypothetical protein KPP03845_105020 [Streptomyces xanthophaeus]
MTRAVFRYVPHTIRHAPEGGRTGRGLFRRVMSDHGRVTREA